MLLPFADRISLAFVYGSVARGEQTSQSDIDLMIVGDVGIAGFSNRLLDVEQRLSRSITPTVFSKREFREKIRAENHFVMSVLSKPVIFLIGDNDDLERLASRKPAKSR